ncbi:MAG: hypothetical protein GY920_18990 [Aliivibrio sp.]|nr:hypothetical protein [Aliivibrio sp.]
MKTSATILSVISIAFSSFTFAFDSPEQRDAIDSQLGNTPSEQTYQNILQSNPQVAPNILSILLNKQGVDPQNAITAAMAAAPDKATEIAQVARDAGVSNEDITSAALLAGVDPTQIAEASAAGTPTNTSVAPPSPPSVGGQGGGGTGAISPS